MSEPNPAPDPARMQQIRNLFERALSLPVIERDAFLRNAAGDDNEMLCELRSLLGARDVPTADLVGDLENGRAGGLRGPRAEPPPSPEQVRSTATGELMGKLTKAPKLDAQRFMLEGELGKGGMGAVMLIHDRHLNRRLAMKVLLDRRPASSDEELRLAHQVLGRFLEEAQVTSQLDHPGVIPVHELGLDQSGKVYFTMRLVKGRTATEVFYHAREQVDGWTTVRALEVILKICDTMAYAHDKGVLHRDLKPANVMVGRFGEVYVMDWGLAKVTGHADRHDLRIRKDKATGESRIASTRQRDAGTDADASVVSMDGQQLGTPSYMSPEQARGEELDARADVYSIGAMLYELLTGRAPYVVPGSRKPAYRILDDVLDGPPKPIEDISRGVPAELVAIANKAMERERADRYASVLALGADIRAFLASKVVSAYRTGAMVELQLWVRRNRPLAATMACLLLVLVVGAAVTANLNRLQRGQLRDSSWGAFNQASRLFVKADETEDPVLCADSAAEGLLQLTRAIALEPTNGVAWERFAIEAAARCELWQRPVATLPHGDHINTVAFSPDGKRVATTTYHGHSARLWDVASGREQATLPHEWNVWVAAFSPDGSQIVTGSADCTAKLWNTSTGTCLLTLPHAADVIRATFSHDGTRLLTGDLGNTAKLWDTKTGRELLKLEHEDAVYSVAFCPDGARLLTAGGNTAAIWDAASGQRLRTFQHDNLITSATFDRDGTRVLTGSFDETAKLWLAATGEMLRSCRGGSYGTMFSPDGTRILTTLEGSRPTLWNTTTGRIVNDFPHEQDDGWGPVMTHDGTRVLTLGITGAQLWEAAARSPLRAWSHSTTEAVAISPDGTLALTGGYSDARLWRTSSITTRRVLDHADITTASLSDDHAYALTGSGDGTAKLWRVDSARHLRTFEHRTRLGVAVLSSDGALVLTAGERTIKIWTSATGDLVRELASPVPIRTAALRRDGSNVLVVGEDHTVQLWDVATGAMTRTLHHDGPVHSAAFSRDGRYIVTASGDRTARLWEAMTGAEARRFPHTHPVLCASFSGDERSVLTAGDGPGALQWTIEDGAMERILVQGGNVQAVQCGGGHALSSIGWDAWLWDTATGKPLAAFMTDGRCQAMALSRDGECVLVANSGFASLHDLSFASEFRRTATASAVEGTVAMAEELTNQTLSLLSELAPLDEQRLRPIRELLQQTIGRGGPLGQLVQWCASQGPEAPAFPGSAITRRQYADILIANGGRAGAQEVLRLDPGHPLVQIALAAYEAVPPNLADGDLQAANADVATRREFLRDYGLSRLPKDAEISARAAAMLLAQGDKGRALVAAEKALAIAPTNETALRVKAEVGH